MKRLKLADATTKDVKERLLKLADPDYYYGKWESVIELVGIPQTVGDWTFEEMEGDGPQDEYSGPVFFYISVSDGETNRVFVKQGQYRSHEGTVFEDWHPFYEVQKVTKTVEVYERIG